MKSGIYGRVSTKEQNLETQLTPVRDYCLRNNLEIIGEYLERGISGAKSSRPQLDLLLQDMREGKFKCIVVYKLDRLGRSLSHLLQLLQEFKNKRIRLVSVVDGVDTDNDSPMNRAFWQLLGIFAELEREMIVARVNDGLQVAKKNGTRLGRPAGSRDKRKRSRSGYLLRYAGTRKRQRRLNGRSKREVLTGKLR